MAQAVKAPTVTAELKDPVVSKGGELITVDSIAGARFPTAEAMRQSFAASLRLPAQQMVHQHGAHGLTAQLEELESDTLVDLVHGDHVVANARRDDRDGSAGARGVLGGAPSNQAERDEQ